MNLSIEGLLIPLSSLVLITAFYMQGQKFIRPMVRGQVTQSLLIAAISVVIGYLENNADFYVLALLIIILRAFLVTYFLERRIGSRHLHEQNVSIAYMFVFSLIFILVAVFIIYTAVFSSISLKSIKDVNGILMFPLALFFLGLFLISSRKSTFTQIIGYIEEENALVLFAVFLLPIPLIIDASVFLDVLALVVISSVVVVEKLTHERVEELRG